MDLMDIATQIIRSEFPDAVEIFDTPYVEPSPVRVGSPYFHGQVVGL